MTETADRVRGFVERLPKAEVHLHFEGAVPMELVHRWCGDAVPRRPPWREHDYRFASFSGDFAESMAVTWKGTCTSLDRLDLVSTTIYQNLQKQNVRYLEMSFGIGAYPYSATETLDAFKRGIPKGMTVRIIGALHRSIDLQRIRTAGEEFIEADALDGVDIHGNELEGDPAAFRDFFETARERNLICKAHAGELRGPESVEEVLDVLRVKRIQHGVRGIESRDLMRRYVDEDITLDLCPWSNVKLGVYPDLASHPVADLHRAGIRVTVNTDDPTPFGQTITDEYAWLVTERGMTLSEVGEIVRNGFEIAWMEEAPRQQSLAEIDALLKSYVEDEA